jgi:hypothetical protein
MTVQVYIIMTQAQRDAGEALNDVNAALGSQEIENPLADNLGLKTSLGVSTVIGMWVAPARLLNDPTYVRWVSTLGTYPIFVIDSDTILAPDPGL